MSYLHISWNPKTRRLIFKALQSQWNFTDGTAAQKPILLSNYRAIGAFLISNIAASILQEMWCQLSPNRYRSAGRNGKMAPGPIRRIRRGHPPPHLHHTAMVQTHNMKTLKTKNPPLQATTAPLPPCISGNAPLPLMESIVAKILKYYRLLHNWHRCSTVYIRFLILQLRSITVLIVNKIYDLLLALQQWAPNISQCVFDSPSGS